MPTVIESYAAGNATSAAGVANIIEGVERATSAPLGALAIGAVAAQLPDRILLAHDPDDAIAKLSDLSGPKTGIASGKRRTPAPRRQRHDGILFQLEVGRAVAKFAAG